METALNPAAQGDAADASMRSMRRAAVNVCAPGPKHGPKHPSSAGVRYLWIPTARDVCLNGDWRQAACAQSIPRPSDGADGQWHLHTPLLPFIHSESKSLTPFPVPLAYGMLWDAPGTPRSLGRPRNTEGYGSVEEGVSSG